MHSNLVFSPPFSFNFGFPSKSFSISSVIQEPRSMRGEIRVSTQVYPIWTITYAVNHARGSEQDASSVYQYLAGFCISMGGQLSDFLYNDPNDNTVVNQGFGLGDGVTSSFQLVRSIGIGQDIVQNLNGTPQIKGGVNPVVSPLGVVTFGAPPQPGEVVTWSGSFYYRVRFQDDGLDFDQFVNKMWEVKKLVLRSVLL